jgi:outer membrane factor, OMF family
VDKKNKFIKVVGISTAIVLSNATLATAEDLANSRIHNQNHQLSNFSDDISADLSPVELAQSTGSSTEIIQPAREPIPNTDELNPSPNPLSFPTNPEEVEVGSQKPITLKQAIEISLKNNKEVEVSRLNVERAEKVLDEANAELYPTFDLNGGLDYGNSAFLDSVTEQEIDQAVEEAQAENPGVPEEEIRNSIEQDASTTSSASFNFSSDVTLGYNIYTGGRRAATIRAAEKQLRSNILDLERVVEVARFETARDYYNLQNADAQVKIQQAAVEDASQTLKDAQLLEKAGLGTRFDVLRAEVELAQAQQQLNTAESEQNIARRQLAETLSLAHNADLATADTIEEAGNWDIPLKTTIVQAFKNRAELEQALLQREIGEEQSKVALASVKPQVGVSASYGLNDDFEDDNIDIVDQYSVGLNLQWRLFDGGAARASAEQSKKDSEIAEAQFGDQRNQIRFAVEQAYFGLRSNQKNITTATKEVELAEESLRLARLRFQAGVGTQTDVIDAQTQLTTARGNRLTSIIEYNQSYIDLQRQVSNTPDNGLQDLP